MSFFPPFFAEKELKDTSSPNDPKVLAVRYREVTALNFYWGHIACDLIALEHPFPFGKGACQARLASESAA